MYVAYKEEEYSLAKNNNNNYAVDIAEKIRGDENYLLIRLIPKGKS